MKKSCIGFLILMLLCILVLISLSACNGESGQTVYSIKFYNDNNTLVQSYSLEQGKTFSIPQNPSKTATAEYSYTFAGWKLKGTDDKAIVAVNTTASANYEYVAVYTAELRKYDIAFYDSDRENATLLYTAEDVAYGEMPVYAGEEPKGAEGYVFVGWNTDIQPVNGETASYYAVYAPSEEVYTVTAQEGSGYKITPQNFTLNLGIAHVQKNTEVIFSVTVLNGFEGNKTVKANGNVVTPINGDYHLVITDDVVITVEGVIKHEHTYNLEIVSADTVKTPATCCSCAVYYMSCRCGECNKGDLAPTFTGREKNPNLHTSNGFCYEPNSVIGTHTKKHDCCKATLDTSETCSFGSWVTTREPTYYEEGQSECVCALCGAIKSKTIDKKAMEIVTGKVVLSSSLLTDAVIDADGNLTSYDNTSGHIAVSEGKDWLSHHVQKATVAGTPTEWRYFRYTMAIDYTEYDEICFKLQTNVATEGGFQVKIGGGSFVLTSPDTYYFVKILADGTVYVNGQLLTNAKLTGNAVVFDIDTHRPFGTYYGDMRVGNEVTIKKSVIPTNDITLVKDNSSAYSVVYETGNAEMEYGARELVKYFKLATGITLPIRGYADISTVGDRGIVVGTKPAVDKGLSFDGIDGSSDYILSSQNKNIYIYGKSGYGVLNGVYGFLNKLFDLEIYYTDTFTISKTNADLVLEQFTDIGDRTFHYLWSGSGELRPDRNSSGTLDYSHQLGFVTDYYCINGGFHNALTLIPYEEYKDIHPEWFYTGTISSGSASGMQLYLAVDNFSTEVGSLAYTVAERMWQLILNDNLKRNIYSFSQMDIDIWPQGEGYENSDALFLKYGTHSAEQIMFMNAVATLIDEKIKNSPSVDRDIILQMLAYNKALVAPHLERAGLSQQDKDAVRLYAGAKVRVVPYVAPVEANYCIRFDDPYNKVKNPQTGKIDENSPTVADVLTGWQAIAEELHMWWYSLDCLNYFMVLDTFESMAYNYKYAYTHGVTCLHDQNQGDTAVMTDWARLKNYLKSSLVKNPDADVEMLINGFMDAYFGAGAPYMKQLLASERKWFNDLLPKTYNTENLGGTYSLGALRSSAWIVNKWQWTEGATKTSKSSSLILQWMDYVQSAKNAINSDSTISAAEKAELCERVDLESLPARYVLLQIFEDTRYDTDLTGFYQFAKSIGMTRIAEGKPIN